MLKIRLTRRGKKNRPFFRIVVAEKSAPIKGRFIEILGFLDPITKKTGFKNERIKYWISKGAQCSATVHNLLIKNKIIAGEKIKKFPHQKKKEETAETKEEKPKTEESKIAVPAEEKIEAKTAEKPATEPGKEPKEIKEVESKKEAAPSEAKPLQEEK